MSILQGEGNFMCTCKHGRQYPCEDCLNSPYEETPSREQLFYEIRNRLAYIKKLMGYLEAAIEELEMSI